MSNPKDNKTIIMEYTALYLTTMYKLHDFIEQEKLKKTITMINIEPRKQSETEHCIIRTYEFSAITLEHLQQLVEPNDIIVIDKGNNTISTIVFKHEIHWYSITALIKDKEISLA